MILQYEGSSQPSCNEDAELALPYKTWGKQWTLKWERESGVCIPLDPISDFLNFHAVVGKNILAKNSLVQPLGLAQSLWEILDAPLKGTHVLQVFSTKNVWQP